eukprot:gene12684-14993_t
MKPTVDVQGAPTLTHSSGADFPQLVAALPVPEGATTVQPGSPASFASLLREGTLGQKRSIAAQDAELYAAIVRSLVDQYPWAGAALVDAVLYAVNDDIAEAEMCLTDMLASEDGADSRLPTEDARAKAGGGSVDCSGHPGRHQEVSTDLYWKHRKPAVELDRAWRRELRRAAVAWSAAEHSLARTYATQARQLRGQALVAHKEAAARIEAELNEDSAGNSGSGKRGGPATGTVRKARLDLHGLHVEEAKEAIDRRLETLESNLATNGFLTLTVIVGRGNHSAQGVTFIPATRLHLRPPVPFVGTHRFTLT